MIIATSTAGGRAIPMDVSTRVECSEDTLLPHVPIFTGWSIGPGDEGRLLIFKCGNPECEGEHAVRAQDLEALIRLEV